MSLKEGLVQVICSHCPTQIFPWNWLFLFFVNSRYFGVSLGRMGSVRSQTVFSVPLWSLTKGEKDFLYTASSTLLAQFGKEHHLSLTLASFFLLPEIATAGNAYWEDCVENDSEAELDLWSIVAVCHEYGHGEGWCQWHVFIFLLTWHPQSSLRFLREAKMGMCRFAVVVTETITHIRNFFINPRGAQGAGSATFLSVCFPLIEQLT